MLQQILVLLLFVTSLAYLGRGLFQLFQPTSKGCAKGCGSCPASKN